MPTSQTSIPLLDRFAEVRSQHSEMQLGQLFEAVALLAEDETGHSISEVDDSELAAALERFASDSAKRAASTQLPRSLSHSRSVFLPERSPTPPRANAGRRRVVVLPWYYASIVVVIYGSVVMKSDYWFHYLLLAILLQLIGETIWQFLQFRGRRQSIRIWQKLPSR